MKVYLHITIIQKLKSILESKYLINWTIKKIDVFNFLESNHLISPDNLNKKQLFWKDYFTTIIKLGTYY